jgi:hypothetical protein
MRKQTPLIAFAAYMLSAGIADAQFLFWPQYTFWRGHYAPFKHKHHHRPTNSESAKNARPEDLPKGPLQIIVSIADQRVSLFDNGASPDRTFLGVHGNSGASYAPRRVQRDQQTTMAPFKYL